MFVGDGSEIDGLDLEGAYAIMTPGADQQATRGGLAALNAAGVEAALLASAPAAAALQAQAARAFAAGRLALPEVADGADEDDGGLPTILFIGQDTVASLMEAAGVEAGAGGAYPLGDTGLALALDADYVTTMVPTENVVAYVEGSDPVLKDEVVVISAHLDHVGDDGEGEDAIYNGADDDGSGTVTMLEIAEAFQKAKDDGHGPRRSILLLHVTGEEEGLLGSEFYADRQPLVPIANTAANLNIDMIGRYDPERGFETTDYVYIIGGDLISQDISDWERGRQRRDGHGPVLVRQVQQPRRPPTSSSAAPTTGTSGSTTSRSSSTSRARTRTTTASATAPTRSTTSGWRGSGGSSSGPPGRSPTTTSARPSRAPVSTSAPRRAAPAASETRPRPQHRGRGPRCVGARPALVVGLRLCWSGDGLIVSRPPHRASPGGGP